MTHTKSKIAAIGLAISVAATLGSAPVAAQAQTGVFNCGAEGKKQEGGAAIGAILGGLLGSQVSKNERAAGAVVGAGLGAAAGSYIGCKSQTNDQYAQGVYTRNGQRLASLAEAFRDGVRRLFEKLKRAKEEGGLLEVERVFKLPFDASG